MGRHYHWLQISNSYSTGGLTLIGKTYEGVVITNSHAATGANSLVGGSHYGGSITTVLLHLLLPYKAG